MTEMKGISRRSFLTGSAVLGGAAALAGLAGCSPAPKEAPLAETGAAEEDWLGEAPALTEADCDNVVDTDVVVIGSAVSGSLSAFGALENGAQVVVLERNKIFHYGGNQGSFLNSEFQKQSGKPVYDPKEIVYHIVGNTANRCDIRQWRAWADRSGELVDTLIEKVLTPAGIPFTCSPAPDEPELWLNRVFDINVVLGDPTKDNYKEFLAGMHAYLADNGADIRYNTKAEVLVQDESGRVTGAICQSKDGSYVQYNASKGVVLATGDISYNDEYINEFAPVANRVFTRLCSDQGNVGDGHNMAAWAGGAFQEGPWPTMMHPQAAATFHGPFLFVNDNGERFMCEDTWVQGKSLAINRQPNGEAWSVFDANWPTDLVNGLPYGGGMFWDSFRPYGSDLELAPEYFKTQIPAYIEQGIAYEADTIEDLAAQIGCDAATLSATVERYNGMCEAGEDTDYYKKPVFLTPVKQGPFYALKVGPALLAVTGGLKCNNDFQCLDENGEVIEGLYVLGNIMGDITAVDYPINIQGNSHGRCLVQGKCLGEQLAGVYQEV